MSRRRPNETPEWTKPAQRAGGAGGRQGWLWGTHPVLAALSNPDRLCRRLLLTSEAARQHERLLADFLAGRREPRPETVDRQAIDSLLPAGAVHQGMALLASPLAATAVEDLLIRAKDRTRAVVVILDQVTDPHNVGAILRSAAAFGALGVIVPDRNSPDETGTLAKAASGALEHVPLVRVTNLARALDTLKEGGFWIAGLDGEAQTTLAAAGLSGKVALVLGAEGEGLRRLTRETCDYLVKLPQTGLVESLNVSNAAACALYELARR